MDCIPNNDKLSDVDVSQDAVLEKVGGGGLELDPADATTLHWEQMYVQEPQKIII